ncbi:type II toxin-antitoxin system VapC family toxin [Dyadobacter jiangsuensis]|uniref:type II toxin-antitoxin system VapC family toxin n=1 Tax=Dyadobacter fermentans TaxID=94254 RepID=UPI001CBD9FC9|nr:type II toxin-antitoxin system VapC family toxin [Dyadobacter fermentans]MBZ1360756.1 type II toxin-antitoxin system VapC family toxin [Dyadobacter fermentans]
MQRYLLDTQVLIWALASPSRLSVNTIDLLANNSIFVSHISLLEIAIKQRIGKLPELPISISELEKVILADGFGLIPISVAHINAYNGIPLHEEHRDPFDRLILATAYSEEMPVVSADRNFKIYKDVISLVEA